MITHNCIASRIASFDSITAAYALVRQELFIERIRGEGVDGGRLKAYF